MNRFYAIPTVALLAMLAGGCGDGASSSPSSGPIGVSPAPTPTPSATPTPSSNVYPSAPFGLVSAQDFTLIGWVRDTDGVRPVSGESYRFGWGRDPDTYRLTTPDFTDGELRYTFPGGNAHAFSVFLADGSDTGAAASVTVDRVYARTFRYLGLLSWYLDEAGGDVIFGQVTPQQDLPKSGAVSYRMDEAATPWEIRVDFVSNTVTGKVMVVWSDSWGPYDPVFYDLENGTFDPATGELHATFTMPNSTIEGQLSGKFMGPAVDEVALAVSGPVLNPYTNEEEVVRYSAPGKRL